MYLGKIVRDLARRGALRKPIHPYTSALLGSIPIPDPRENRARERTKIERRAAEPDLASDGLSLHTRCPACSRSAGESEPQLSVYAGGHLAACHFPGAVSAEEAANARRRPSAR